jgi:hypothetical protein
VVIQRLKQQIGELRSRMQPLEPDGGARQDLGGHVMAHALAYLDQVPGAPSNRPWAEVFSQQLEPEFQEQGRDPSAVLAYIAACVDQPGFATTSPRFMA